MTRFCNQFLLVFLYIYSFARCLKISSRFVFSASLFQCISAVLCGLNTRHFQVIELFIIQNQHSFRFWSIYWYNCLVASIFRYFSDLFLVSLFIMATADIGLIGLAVMGQNLVLNMNDHGFTVRSDLKLLPAGCCFQSYRLQGWWVFGWWSKRNKNNWHEIARRVCKQTEKAASRYVASQSWRCSGKLYK